MLECSVRSVQMDRLARRSSLWRRQDPGESLRAMPGPAPSMRQPVQIHTIIPHFRRLAILADPCGKGPCARVIHRSWLAGTASFACSDPLTTARKPKKRRSTLSRLRPIDGVPQPRLAGNQPLTPASFKICSTSGTTMPVLSNSSSYTRLLAPNCCRMMASAADRMPSISGP